MEPIRRSCRVLVIGFVLVGGIIWSTLGQAEIIPGQTAPVFSLKDMGGQTYDLAQMKEKPMIILYFFDIDSRPSQEGLITLHQLSKRHRESDVAVLAITLSSRDTVSGFVSSTGLAFPVLLDRADVSSKYNARQILPSVTIIGPNLKILDHFQGGGKTTETMLVRVAERELQRRKVTFARALTDEVIRKHPQNIKAKAVKAYAALKEAKYKEAEDTFLEVVKTGGEGEILGKEGLASVYAKKDEPDRALQLARELEREAPDRSYPHVVKGDILYAQNKKKEAQEEYQKAVEKKAADPYQDGIRFNKLGRVYAGSGQYKKAMEMYDKALAIDPYYIEVTTNKGVAHEKEGRWDKALESYQHALALDKNDSFAVVLAQKAQEMLDLQKDAERKKRVDQLVKDLAERYRSRKETGTQRADEWTSPPMIMTFVGFQEKGGLAERDGSSLVFTAQLAGQLNATGRVKVVERVILDKLLEELNIGSSEMANPETALKLGKVLAAKLIGTGSIYFSPEETLFSFRLIDTETSEIPQVSNRQWPSQVAIEKETFQLNREILRTVIQKYPLRGFVAKLAGDHVVLNLGAKQGVVAGTKFDVLEDQEAITYKGKTLQSSPKVVSKVEVVKVEPDFSFAKVLSQERSLKVDDKIQERIEGATIR